MITSADIKLLASERMTDTTDGGGRRTSNVIPDGVPGNIFPKVSRTDGVYGRVNLRKVYALVDTLNTDTYGGAHAAIIDDADNEKIKVNLFTTTSDFDDRTAARDRIESYVISGPESRMALYGRQLVGQRAISVVQRIEQPLPAVGEVYCLSNEIGGVISTQQYVRIENVAHEVRTFTDSAGDFDRRVITLTLSNTLRYQFAGADTVSRSSNVTRDALVRATTVADAARYFSVENLNEAALAGALTVKVRSVFSNLVPTNTRESAVNSAEIGGALQYVQAAANPLPARSVGDVFPANSATNKTQTINLGAGVLPGSLKVGVLWFGMTPIYVSDDGAGNLVVPGGNYAGVNSGTIDYGSGTLTVRAGHGGYNSNGVAIAAQLNVILTPAVQVGQAAHQHEIPVTLATRGTVQVLTLNPLPAKGTVYVDYRALGKWYRLVGDGKGVIGGDDAAYGTGTVDFVTGSLIVTLGALPDVGSSVIVGWGSPAHFQMRTGASATVDTVVRQDFTLTSLPVKPGTVSVSYISGTATYTAVSDVNGNITGGGITGTVNHTTGAVELCYSTRGPNPASPVTVTYTRQVANSDTAPTSTSGTSPLVTWGDPTLATVGNIALKGLRVAIPVQLPAMQGYVAETVVIPANDDGAGHLVTLAMTGASGSRNYSHAGGTTVGTVNYATGVVSIDPNASISVHLPVWVQTSDGGGSWLVGTKNVSALLGDYAWVLRTTNGSTDAITTATISLDNAPLSLDFTVGLTDSLVPGSLQFSAFGQSYFDRNGVLYCAMQPDGSGTVAGSVDYANGIVYISTFTSTASFSVNVMSCLTKHGEFSASKATFRTAGSPLRPASTFIQVTAEDGTVLSTTTDQSGNLLGGGVRGAVNQQFGLVNIEWGQMVVAAGNETQPWYSAANVQGGMIWKPTMVMPSTLRYSSVVISNLPVDANILGVDPVRLPTDGRVPIFRAGDVVLIHNSTTTVLPNPVVAGTSYNVGRASLADLTLVDANGTAVPANQYAVDLSAGSVTMAADMSLGALVQPLTARHRIEELNLATDVQIDGQLSLSAALSRDFDTNTRVSSCLMFGDMFAHVSGIFDQVSWTGTWSDTRIGSDATPTFNNAAFPMTVTNKGALTERWRLNFTSATAFQIIGEMVGVIGTGDINTDCSPVNPLTGQAYFFIPKGGWGTGWAVGNQLRFNTIGASGSIWMARTVLPGATLAGDSIDIQVRGDVDA